MKSLTDEARAALAQGWDKSGLSQAEYARQAGISERTLRAWRQKYAPPGEPVEVAKQVVRKAISQLQAVLDGLDAEPACRSAEVKQMPAGEPTAVSVPGLLPADRQGQPAPDAPQVVAGTEARDPARAGPAPAAVVERPKKRKPSFFDGC